MKEVSPVLTNEFYLQSGKMMRRVLESYQRDINVILDYRKGTRLETSKNGKRK